jgi:hypothetical protein
MYIFTRSRRLNPATFRAGLAAAIDGGSRASALIGEPVTVWSTMLSPPVGTVVWSMRVDDLDALVGHGDALAADDGFDEWIRGSDSLFAGPLTDSVSEVMAGAPSGPPAAYLSVVSGVCANGSLAAGMTVGVEIAEAATRITGHSTAFTVALTGAYGAVNWVAGLPDLGALGASNQALAASQEWLELVDRAGSAFAQGVTVTILRRLS